MNKPAKKTLSLSTSTVRSLTGADLATAAGGAMPISKFPQCSNPESKHYCGSDICPSWICV